MTKAINIVNFGRPRMAIGNFDDRKESNIATQQHTESIDIININEPTIVHLKRERGRPRKYPTKVSTSVVKKPIKLVIRNLPCPIPDLLESTKEPGMPSVWGNIKKRRRDRELTCKFKCISKLKREAAQYSDSEFTKDQQLSAVKIKLTESRCPSSDESNSTVSESDCTTINTDMISDLDSNEDESWFSQILIPGPIPDLNTLFRDDSLSIVSNVFAAVPALEDWELKDLTIKH